jgi:uncharacterized protein YbaR (Trm112 family)/SAM-dependent methyltransferase
MSLSDILACPTCKVRVIQSPKSLTCTRCAQTFPVVNGIPVMFPAGNIPTFQHQGELQVRTSYDPWVHRVILQSLLDNQVAVEVGSGNMALDDPCIIRMDVNITPYVDVVGDVHHLPFLPESVDYIFSLAVFEHLQNPFVAAQSIYDTLKDGGYIYHECNFVFAYHGYPHHYFNASLQGLEQVFSQFACQRKGVATYQMPSFALNSLLQTYLRHSHADQYDHGRRLTSLLRQVLAEDLIQYDIYFSEEDALNVAAGTYFAGMKKKTPTSTLIPVSIREIWERVEDLRNRFPDLNQLTTTKNILLWAKSEGRKTYPEISRYLDGLQPFSKKEAWATWQRTEIHCLPLVEPHFGAVGFDPHKSMAENAESAAVRLTSATPPFRERSLRQKARAVLANEGVGSLVGRGLRLFSRKFFS